MSSNTRDPERTSKSRRRRETVKKISEEEEEPAAEKSALAASRNKTFIPRGNVHQPKEELDTKYSYNYESSIKLWDSDVQLQSECSSDACPESANQDSTSTSSLYLQYQSICGKCMDYINPCKFLTRFRNEEGQQELTNDTDKRDFFCLVMIIKCFQFIFIASFISLPSAFEPFHEFLSNLHRHWVLIPFGLCSITVTTTRMFPTVRTLESYYHVAAFFTVTCCYAYFLASLASFYDSQIIGKVFWLLPGTVLFVSIFVIAMKLSVVKRLIYISALSSVLFFAIAMALLPIIYEGNPGFKISVDIWLPSLIAAEILIFLLIFELQSILMGERGIIHKNDYWFVSLYL